MFKNPLTINREKWPINFLTKADKYPMLPSLIVLGLTRLMRFLIGMTSQLLSLVDGPAGRHELTIMKTSMMIASTITIH